MNKLKVLDCFSGAGMFSLGLERTRGFETVAFCEIEEFPRKVLAKHWPGVPCYEDVTKLTSDVLERDGISVDVITGGFPCQDLSSAGKRGGIEAERSGLWGEIVRLISELRPSYVIIENVADLLVGESGGWFSKVLTDLAECGYDAEWENIPAGALGGQHLRERVWIVAYPDKVGFQGLRPISQFYPTAGPRLQQERLQVHKKDYNGICGSVWSATTSRVFGMVDGDADRPHRLAIAGNSLIPQIPEMIGHAILESMK